MKGGALDTDGERKNYPMNGGWDNWQSLQNKR